jgi:hypothetical protein
MRPSVPTGRRWAAQHYGALGLTPAPGVATSSRARSVNEGYCNIQHAEPLTDPDEPASPRPA